MTHFRYVRTEIRGPQGPERFGTPIFRVMPARFLLLSLLLPSLSIYGQSFLHVTCDSACLPAFASVPEDVVVPCLEAFPDFEVPSASGCAESPIENVPTVELDATSIERHDVMTALGDGPDWALWLGGFEAMGHGASDYFVPYGDGISFEQYANGTARFTGEMVNDSDADQRFELNVFLQYGQDYDAWTAQGRLPKDDLGLEAYADWMFYEVVDTLSHLIGRGNYEGDMLYLDHMPVTRLFGFQVGELGANNRNTNMGVSGWFWYRGMIGGQSVVGTGDVNADLENTENVGPACPVVEESRRVAMAWSACGHDLIEQTVERIDEEAPVFISLPPLESASCLDLPDTADFAAFEVYDACGSALTLSNADSVAGEPCNQVAYRTWTLTDACDNTSDTLQSVALVDTTGPTFSVEDVTLSCDLWDSYAVFEPTFSDDCSPGESVTWSYEDEVISGDFPVDFVMDRTYTATDLCGNPTEETMTITVIDTVAPTLTDLPEDITISCEEWPSFETSPPSAQDICDPAPTGPTSGASDTTITPGDCSGNFTVLFTYTFSDLSGNTASHSQTVTVEDVAPPVFSFVPEAMVIDCSEDWPQPMDDPTLMATAEDLCGTTAITWADDTLPGDCPGSFILERTFTATDDCGNSATASTSITSEDVTPPAILNELMDEVIACGEELPVVAAVAVDDCAGVEDVWITVDTVDISAGDAVSTGFESCTLDGFVAEGGTISISNDAFDGTCALSMLHSAGEPLHNFYPADIMAGLGTYQVMARADGFISDNIVELLAGDDEGSPSLKISLRPQGTDNPGISLSGFGLDENADATMQQGDWYEVTVELGAADLTLMIDGSAVLEVDLPDGLPEEGRFKLASAYAGTYDDMSYLPEDPCPVVERYIRTIHATDFCDNTATLSQVIDVIDTVAPIITFFPEDLTIDCTDAWPMPEESSDWMATAEDACTAVTVTWSDEIVPNTCPGSSTLYRTFTATDECGNATSQMQTIAQEDVDAPMLDEALLPADTLVSCDAVPAPLDSSAFGATDNCNLWTFAISSDTIPGSCEFAYTRVDTYTFTDCDGNATEFVHNVEVEDIVPPVFTFFPENDSIPCTQDFPAPTDSTIYMAAAEDNCSLAVVTWSDEVAPNACPGSSTLMRTFTAVDACGNATSQTQTITQFDDEAPQLDESLLPADTVVNCDDVPPVLDSLAFSVTDNCNTWSFEVTSDSIPGACGPAFVRVDTYTFMDCDSNTTAFVHTVTVQDTTPPLFTFFPENDSIACTEDYPEPTDSDLLLATADDNCSDVEVTWQDEIVAADCPGLDTLFRTFTALDVCGNATALVQTMFRYDDEGPVIGVFPNDTTIDCDPVNEMGTLDSTFFAAEDNCNPWTFAVETEYEGEEIDPCNYSRFDTYTFTDCSDNVTTFVHEITVQDTTGPNIELEPIDLYLMCPQEVPEFDITLPVSEWMDDAGLEVSDDCNSDPASIMATYEDIVTVSVDPTHYTLSREWTFTDHCGYATNYEQVIDVNEPQPILPNAFSPPGPNSSGNGFNDTYVIENIGDAEDGAASYPPCNWGEDSSFIYFQVFNRWGSPVYSSPPGEMYRNDWDGINSSTGNYVVNGTYFILLQYEDGRQWGQYVDVRND